ncbi:MAG: RAMP superfamily CRISPR-associated protein [Deltaproteobacteria bacterium]|nr:RAMP superfamily CRISPR-associated protein [Deltaproteobacteria bacterium]
MHEITIAFELLAYWHVGTGRGSGPLLDAQVFRTPAGLPCIPGRTLKGLLREAVEAAEAAGVYRPPAESTARAVQWFGSALDPEGSELSPANGERRFATQAGSVWIGDARLGQSIADSEAWERWATGASARLERDSMFRSFASTKIDEDGIVADKTLRSIEVVVPMTLHAQLRAADEGALDALAQALLFIDGVGSHRTRGFGRCRATVVARRSLGSQHAGTIELGQGGPSGREIRCAFTLETDVAVTERAATVGGHRSLGYLPGSSILGAIARGLYSSDEAWTRAHDWALFFSGGVRFGHATIEGATPAPLSLHVAKGGALGGNVQSATNLAAHERSQNDPQWVQLRDRWVKAGGSLIEPRRRKSMRTAIEARGRARDGYLYEIDALERGQMFRGTIAIDTGDPALDEEIERRIRSVLARGRIELGKSTGQEFGVVTVSLDPAPTQVPEAAGPNTPRTVTVWCLSDVALSDAHGQPTYAPEAAMFGLPAGWQWSAERSFVRTRQWAPFRHRRSTVSQEARPYAQRPATERSVLSAGSVLVFVQGTHTDGVDLDAVRASVRRGVGLYTSEGLGRVSVEPDLLCDRNKLPEDLSGPNEQPEDRRKDAPLVAWLRAQAEQRTLELAAWTHAQKGLRALRQARVRLSATQWGALRGELRRLGATPDRIDGLKKYLDPSRNTSAPSDGKEKAQGHGQRAHFWKKERVSGKSLAEWIVEFVEFVDVAEIPERHVRWEALSQICEWAPRQQRAGEEREERRS